MKRGRRMSATILHLELFASVVRRLICGFQTDAGFAGPRSFYILACAA